MKSVFADSSAFCVRTPMAGSIVEEKLAMKLDQALKTRGSTNVFEILRAEFVANALPVDGVLFERVATYAMQNY